LIIGIDASRCRSGGARAHLIGILSNVKPELYGVDAVHVWSYSKLLDSVPDANWLIKHRSEGARTNILWQLLWQYFNFPKEASEQGCHIVLNTDAGTVSAFGPSITMSRDMLSFERGEIDRFKFGKAKLRLLLLRTVQLRSLARSRGVIFLTDYAANVIQSYGRTFGNIRIIPHGVGAEFKDVVPQTSGCLSKERIINCIYVSNVALYKHQWHIVSAVKKIRELGYNVKLKLVGGHGLGQSRLAKQISISDPGGAFVEQLDFVPQNDIPALLGKSHIFVFASSCENMPNTLLEGMAAGLPVACSNRGPMPEILLNGGVYFDPEDSDSVKEALLSLITHDELRLSMAKKSKLLSQEYTWQRCADETFRFLVDICREDN